MLNTLRNRLLASYVMILLVLLGLVGFVLLVFLATRPLPTDDITNRLTAALLNIRLIERARIQIALPDQAGTPENPFPSITIDTDERAIAFLNEEAALHNMRALLVTNNGDIVFDSAGSYQPGDRIDTIERQTISPVQRPGMPRALAIKGRFEDPDGRAWVYVAQPVRPLVATEPDSLMVMVAAPVPQASLKEVIRVFGNNFLQPLARAGLIGLVIAIALAFLISRSVARPLQRISQAARRIASGDYRQQVPVEGPEEVRALAQTFNYMAGRVASTQQAQRDFLANVSHDLRTPLTSIQGFSQAIMEGVAADPDSAQHAARVIHDEAGRLHRLVESLLDLARIEAGQLDIRQNAVALSDLLDGIGASLSLRAQEKGLTLALDVPPDLPRIPGDGDRLAQVFTNLLDNAITHTPPGGTVTLAARAETGGIAVTVQDTGTGIPAEDLPRVFERFYQVDKSRESNRRSGMGLGLAITKQIVEAHGGTIRVASKAGEGTIFTVWLPFRAPEMATVKARR